MDEVAFGRYRLIALIGEGGMGQVFKAHDTAIGRDVAIKVLPPEMATVAGYRERFRREAQIAARLTEPHIIPIHDLGEIDGRLYLVMPIIEGVDVHTVLQREGPMTPSRAVRVIQQLAAALNAAHRNGLIHRDIKPSNALMTADEHVYLIDFGIAHDASATRLTQTGMMVGTFSYMAPERFMAGTVDARADVYALTCVLHECLTGAKPFPGNSMEQQIAGHLTMEPPKPSSFNPAIPAGFDQVIARGMAKQPGERYQNAIELSTAAQHALNSAPTPPPPPLIDERRRVGPPGPQRPPFQVRPVGPTIPGTQQRPVEVNPFQATQLADTQMSPLVGRPAAGVPAASSLGAGRFAGVLVGIVLVSLATAGIFVPWDSYYPWDSVSVASALAWLIVLGTVPGIVLLVLGRGRAHADRTMAGCALVTLGPVVLLYLFWPVPAVWLLLLAIAGLLLILVTALPRPTPPLVRGIRICGTGILAFTLLEVLLFPFGPSYAQSVSPVIGAVVGVVLAAISGIARRSTPGGPPLPATATPAISAGGLSSVLAGVVLLAIAVAALVAPRTGRRGIHFYWYTSHEDYRVTGTTLVWLVMLAAIPGIVLLVLGRGRAHADDTMTGCALVALALTTPLLDWFGPWIPDTIIASLLLAVISLLSILIAVYRRPTEALARGCVLFGTGVIVLTLIVWLYHFQHMVYYFDNLNAVFSTLFGAILIAAGIIALPLARRVTQAPAPSLTPPAARR